MRRGFAAGVVAIAVISGAAAVAAAAVASSPKPGKIVAAAAGRGFFRSRCDYSHTRPDDPILMPGKPGMSMVHDFFGNTSTTADSTAAGLRAATHTSCLAPGDTSAYWVPALYQHGTRVVPDRALVYYRDAGRKAATIQTLPPGLQMIAGDEAAMAPQSTKVAYWNCGARANVRKSALPPASCPAGSQLVLSLVFPDCWNGHTLAGASRQNVAYAVGGGSGCPSGYPVAIPQVVIHVHYPISRGDGLTLSMGPSANTMPHSIYTAHADLFNAWDPNVLASLVERCDGGHLLCGTVGPANQPLGESQKELRRMRERERAHRH